MKRSIKIYLKKLFEYFGYTIKKNYPNEIFQFPREFFPVEMTELQKKIIKNSEIYSMTGRIRMSLLIKTIEHIKNENIEGDIVECGVWKGGNLICAQLFLNELKLRKKIFGFDTFEGMTEPSKHDVQELQIKSFESKEENFSFRKRDAKTWMEREDKKTNEGKNIWAYCSIQDVENHIKKKVPINDINLIKGPVEKTLLIEKNIPEKISLLRLDTDFYESTKIELEVLYPKLQAGGFLIIDDYGHWKGSRKAVDEFFNKKKPFIHFVDETCRLIIKK